MSVGLKRTCTARHHIAIEIHGVNWVRDCNFCICGKNFLNVTDIALGTVTDKHIVRIHFNSARRVFTTNNRFTEKIVTLFRAVTTECPLDAHFVHSLVHRLDYGRD